MSTPRKAVRVTPSARAADGPGQPIDHAAELAEAQQCRRPEPLFETGRIAADRIGPDRAPGQEPRCARARRRLDRQPEILDLDALRQHNPRPPDGGVELAAPREKL